MAQRPQDCTPVRLIVDARSSDESVMAANGGLMQEVGLLPPRLWGTLIAVRPED